MLKYWNDYYHLSIRKIVNLSLSRKHLKIHKLIFEITYMNQTLRYKTFLKIISLDIWTPSKQHFSPGLDASEFPQLDRQKQNEKDIRKELFHECFDASSTTLSMSTTIKTDHWQVRQEQSNISSILNNAFHTVDWKSILWNMAASTGKTVNVVNYQDANIINDDNWN